MIVLLGMLLVLGVLVLYGGAKQRARKQTPMLRKAGDGYVLLRQHATEHFCRPPDVDDEPQFGDSISLKIGVNAVRWSPGDLWLCECGKAWKINGTGGWVHDQKWKRSPMDDLV